MFDVAQKIKHPVVAIPAGGKTGDKELTNRSLNISANFVNRLKAGEINAGCQISQGASIYNLATQIQLLNEVKSPALGVNLDPREIYKAGEDYSEVISKLGKKIVHTHIALYPSPEQEPALPEEQILGRGKNRLPPDSPEAQAGWLSRGAFPWWWSAHLLIRCQSRWESPRSAGVTLTVCLQELK